MYIFWNGNTGLHCLVHLNHFKFAVIPPKRVPFYWYVFVFPPQVTSPKKQTNNKPWPNGHSSLLSLTTKLPYHVCLLPPTPAHHPLPPFLASPPRAYLSLSPHQSVWLFVFAVLLQKQMVSSLSLIQRRSTVGWNLMPTCTPRHAFHTTNGSLLSVCLHCWA